jgi:hypothetical protein
VFAKYSPESSFLPHTPIAKCIYKILCMTDYDIAAFEAVSEEDT